MKITKEKLEKLNNLYSEKEKISHILSELVKTAQDRNGDNEVELEREGKKIKITEKIMWQEVYYGGAKSQSGKILKEKYPEAFEAFEKQTKIDGEISKFVLEEFGFMFNQLDLPTLLKLIEAMIEYKKL